MNLYPKNMAHVFDLRPEKLTQKQPKDNIVINQRPDPLAL